MFVTVFTRALLIDFVRALFYSVQAVLSKCYFATVVRLVSTLIRFTDAGAHI